MNDSKNKKIEITRGDSISWNVTVYDKVTNEVKDLTDYTMRFTVKENKSDLDSAAIIGPVSATISAPTTGVGNISLSKSDTDVSEGSYWYDVQIDNGTDTHTVLGPVKNFHVLNDVTKETD